MARSRSVTLNVVLFSYLPRPIIDVYLGGTRLGLARPYPHSGAGTITGVEIELGLQAVRWRLDGPKGTPGNGERMTTANALVLDTVPPDARFLGVNIYPDYTVELLCSVHFPELSERGEQLDRDWRKRMGAAG